MAKKYTTPVYFLFKGKAPAVNLGTAKKIDIGEYFSNIIIYTIIITHYDSEETVVEYHNEVERDKEYQHLIETMEDEGVTLINKL